MNIEAVLEGRSEWHVEQADSLQVMKALPAESIDVVLFSPPYWSQRAYLPDDHPDKVFELGNEPDPGTYLEALLAFVDEAHRVLRSHGSLFINIDDTYAGSGGAGGDYAHAGLRDGQRAFKGSAWRTRRRQNDRRAEKFRDALPKSLCGIPEALHLALVYGRSPFTGAECSQWRVRNRLNWIKRNPSVGFLADRWRRATEPIFFAVKDARPYFDLDAIRRTPKYGFVDQTRPSAHHWNGTPGRAPQLMNPTTEDGRINSNAAGAPPLDWSDIDEPMLREVLRLRAILEANGIEISDDTPGDSFEVSPAQFSGAHFAVFPNRLIFDPIEAACPRRICRECGEPSRRILKPTPEYESHLESLRGPRVNSTRTGRQKVNRLPSDQDRRPAEYMTVGWTECGHNDWMPGIVFDPFTGSGTTGVVARRLGRRFLGAELSAEYADMARSRIARALLPEPKRTIPVDRPGQASLLEGAG